MRCLYCDKLINKYSFKSLFLEDDLLCLKCRKELQVNKRIVNLGKIEVETFYEYGSLFKDILIQYKECYDEALYPIFLYGLKDYIHLKYRGYKLVLVNSSNEKLMKRGFNHLRLIFETLKMPIVDCIKMKDTALVQEGKNLNERKRMQDNYYFVGGDLENVLICDDVLTTGSSVLGVYRALNGHCKKIKALCLASISEKNNKF